MWLPAFIAFFCLIADSSFLFFGQNKVYRILQDANRSLSVGRLESEDEVIAQVTAALTSAAPNARVAAVISNGVITTEAIIPASDLVATNIFTALVNLDLVVASSQYIEY